MSTIIFTPNRTCIFLALLVLLISGEFQKAQVESTPIQDLLTSTAKSTTERGKNLNTGFLSLENENLSPFLEATNSNSNFGLVEVNEDEIPEDTEVYVLEEYPENIGKADEEMLDTASNIVFRPIFRYRGKQQALRRHSNGIRRRYFVPKRYYRQVYYPSYYNNGFYYY